MIFARAENNPSLRSSCPLHLYIIGSPAILFLAIMLHNVCFILHLSFHKWCPEKNVLAKPQRSSLRIHLCASERSEQAILGVFNSFTVKKVSFFTINVKVKVILSSKSGGGDVCTGHPPTQKSGGGDTSPIPPGFTPVVCVCVCVCVYLCTHTNRWHRHDYTPSNWWHCDNRGRHRLLKQLI